jgi:hypothetical protein
MRRHAARRALCGGPGRAAGPGRWVAAAPSRGTAPSRAELQRLGKVYKGEFVLAANEARFFVHNIPSDASEEDVKRSIERVCAARQQRPTLKQRPDL